MGSATVNIGKEHYKMQAISGGNNQLISDEPEDVGGANLGFSPDELLCASLGACTSATLRMYAERKGWALESVEVKVHLERPPGTAETLFSREITLIGSLDEDQKQRLRDIAGKCPVHKTLTNPVRIETTIL